MKAAVAASVAVLCVSIFACCRRAAHPPADQDTAASRPPLFETAEGRSVAYLARDYVSVFYVGGQDVLAVTFALPESETPVLRASVAPDRSSANIIHYHGPDVSSFVLPAGPARPFPAGPDYSQRSATAGAIMCRDPPRRGRFEYGRRIEVSIRGLDFGDGGAYDVEPVAFTVHAFPP